MSASFSWKHHSLVLVFLVLAVSLGGRADDVDPEPRNVTRDETATPAVDLNKAKTDKKLAAQVLRHQAASKDHLSRIARAFHAYLDAKGHFPVDVDSKAGKPLLSWRVAILPHIGENKLYKEFKLDVPWDSKHNKKLLARMPAVFKSPRVKLKLASNTVYQVFVGPNAPFGRGFPPRIANIPDGTSNTILGVESSSAVPWTKPGGIPFDRTKKLPDFGKAYGKRPLAAMMDGSVRVLDLKKIQPETLKNAIDPADGNPFGLDWNE
jgi:hypothetical protein